MCAFSSLATFESDVEFRLVSWSWSCLVRHWQPELLWDMQREQSSRGLSATPGPPLQVELELEHNFCWRPHSQYLQFWWHLGFAQLGAFFGKHNLSIEKHP